MNEHRAGTDPATEWDERYAERDQHWSGAPNGALVAEVADLAPGTALDVGCGEGADAIWLAEQGWVVTGLDISTVAIERARQVAAQADVSVELIAGDFASLPEDRTFDLVSLQYPALPIENRDASVRALLAATAPGGTLLVVGHDIAGSEHARRHAEEHGFDPADYVQPPDVAASLDHGWTIEVDEIRPRVTPPGFEGPDIDDVVLRARRSGSPG